MLCSLGNHLALSIKMIILTLSQYGTVLRWPTLPLPDLPQFHFESDNYPERIRVFVSELCNLVWQTKFSPAQPFDSELLGNPVYLGETGRLVASLLPALRPVLAPADIALGSSLSRLFICGLPIDYGRFPPASWWRPADLGAAPEQSLSLRRGEPRVDCDPGLAFGQPPPAHCTGRSVSVLRHPST